MARVRLTDIAEEAGVSLATASLALSGKGRISQEVRNSVREIADRLGYSPDLSNAIRRRKRGRYVGVLYNEERTYEWGFIRPIMIECEELLLAASFAPIVVPVRPTQTAQEIYDTIKQSAISGVLSVQYCNEEVFRELEKTGVPIVLMNKASTRDLFYSVGVDDFQGAYEGSRYLCELGHRRILYVEYDRPDYPMLITDRFIGFKKALDECKLDFPPEFRISLPFMDEHALFEHMTKAFANDIPPTAIFAHDDFLAAYVVDAVKKLGLSVPNDISLIAPGDILDYSYPWVPQITTMRIDTELLGKTATNLLLDRFQGQEDSGRAQILKVKQHLVKRSSCKELARL